MRFRREVRAAAQAKLIVAKAMAASACFALAVLSSTAHANEGEGGGSPGGHGGGGNGFQEHMLKIPQLKREAEELEASIKHLIEEKRESEDDAQVRQLTTEIAEKYKTLKETGEKLEKETTLVRFKYPEQAEALDRKYIRFKTKSLRDIASEVGIDGKLDRIHTKVLATFPVPEIEAKKNAPPRINPVFLRKPASVEPQDVPEKIVLKK